MLHTRVTHSLVGVLDTSAPRACLPFPGLTPVAALPKPHPQQASGWFPWKHPALVSSSASARARPPPSGQLWSSLHSETLLGQHPPLSLQPWSSLHSETSLGQHLPTCPSSCGPAGAHPEVTSQPHLGLFFFFLGFQYLHKKFPTFNFISNIVVSVFLLRF